MNFQAVSIVQKSRSALIRFVLGTAACAAAGFAMAQSPAMAAPQETVLYSFQGGGDGTNPQAGVIFGPNGAIFGTTSGGGAFGGGTVFQLAPAGTDQIHVTKTILHSFKGGSDGRNPTGSLLEIGGFLYGATFRGGTPNNGTIFQLTPPAKGQTQWTETVIYSFQGQADGIFPQTGLISDSSGALYGTTNGGGTGGFGTVFKLTPPPPGQTQWTKIVLHNFAGSMIEGIFPQTGLIFDTSGALYGMTNAAGAFGGPFNGGTVYKLTPPAAGQSQWPLAVLHNFGNGNDGSSPNTFGGSLVFDTSGALYGTTQFGGTSNSGTVFQLTPPAEGQTLWTEKVIHNFQTGIDGINPLSSVIFDTKGALYGTTNLGGALGASTVYRLTRPAAVCSGLTPWMETVLHSFGAGGDGNSPAGSLIFGAGGALYGTTSAGGTSNAGTVYAVTGATR